MDFFFFLNEIVFAYIEGLFLLLVYMLLFDNRDFIQKNKFKAAIFLSGYAAISYFSTVYIPAGIHTVLILIFTITLLSFTTRINLYSSILTAMVTIILISLIELPVCLGLAAILKMDLSYIIADTQWKLFFNILIKTIEFLTLFLLNKFKLNLFKYNIFKKDQHYTVIVILQIFFITIAFSAAPLNKNTLPYYTLLFALYFFALLLGHLELKEREQMLETQRKTEVQREYVKNLETIIDVIRKEKHEFANQLNSLITMCLIRKPDTLDRVEFYARKLINNAGSSYKFYNTGNTYVDGLLAVKSNVAFEKGIELDICLGAPLNRANVDDIDLGSILGNIIDNAFDAVGMNPAPEYGVVTIDAHIENEKYFISINNNGVKIPENHLERIFENRFSTKKRYDSKEERGFGLFITKQLVLKNQGRINVTSTKDLTEFLLEFNLRKQDDDILDNDMTYVS